MLRKYIFKTPVVSFALFIILFTFVSCGSGKVHKTFGFVDFKDVNELSDKYSGMSILSMRHNYPINIVESFYIQDEQIKTFELSFPESNKVTIKYKSESDSTIEKQFTLEGKKVKNAFIIYLKKNNTFIPFLLNKTDIDQIRIGKNMKGDLIIETYIEKSGAALSISSGEYYEDVRVFEKAN